MEIAPSLSRRDLQAQQTRREIIAAARGLFAGQGYVKTSVAQIARAAGVSVQTIYDSVGSKRAIVLALNDYIDEEADVGALAAQIGATNNPTEVIGLVVAITRQIQERCADLVRLIWVATPAEAELEAVRAESLRRHKAGIRGVAEKLAHAGALREDVSVDEAADVITAMLWPSVVQAFIADMGWSFDQWDAWARRALPDLVLKSAN